MGEIFGFGIEELLFIGILIALLFGPESIPKIARGAGKLLNRLFRSPLYKEGQQIRKQIRDIPTALARLAELEDLQKNLNSEIKDLKAAMNVDSDGKLSETIASLKDATRIERPAEPPASAATPASAPTESTDADSAAARQAEPVLPSTQTPSSAPPPEKQPDATD
jgi:sec-independent protein translocase protein TatB